MSGDTESLVAATIGLADENSNDLAVGGSKSPTDLMQQVTGRMGNHALLVNRSD